MKTYVFGDVHGMWHKLRNLLDKIPFREDRDRLVFLGDLVNRGPDSRAVIDLVLELRERGLAVVCLRGNHELMFRDYLNGRNRTLFLVNGGESTLYSYRTGRDMESRVPERHAKFLDGLLPWFELEHHILVHAGLKPGVPLSLQEDKDLYWIRNEFISSTFDFGKKVVFGHTPFREPFVDGLKIGIDTGAVYGNRLTCVCLPDEVFTSV